ncbi:B-cell scaffold protein with ankyrin repeats-like, partial [Leptonychotes weddellii]|uniref:B-cell scaffold protein with ankyrin repeats n=1 Tax=Leptonychotes weddellii TaxID=9713 RepID=A0A7F8RLA0_LEPWE
MLPAASVRTGGSWERASGGPAPPENTRDIIMIYEEDAEEWALYLTEVFLHVVKREAVLLYRLENYSFWDLELLSLNSYKCKLLILSNGLLKDLTPRKCQFLEKVLHSPESVVTLLCGVTSSDQLYKLLNIAGGRWEMSTEQEPQDYIAVIESIIFRDFPAGSVNVRVYCDGVMKATTEMKYSTTAKPVENLLGMAHPGDGVCQ